MKNNNKVLKIVYVNTFDKIGGAARVMMDLKKCLENKCSIKVLVGYKMSDDKNINIVNQTIIVKNNKLYKILQKIIYKIRYLRSFLFSNDIDCFSNDSLINHPWIKEADIVHFHNIHGNYINIESLNIISKSKPIILTTHDLWSMTAHCGTCEKCKNWNKGKHFTPGLFHYQGMLFDNKEYLWNKKKNIFNRSVKCFVLPSRWIQNKYYKSYLSKCNNIVINNGVQIVAKKYTSKSIARRNLNLPNRKTLLFIANGGRNNPSKGGDIVTKLSLKEKYKNVNFLIIGEKESKRINNMVILPYLDHKKLSEYYMASDIFLFPSLAENFPLVTLEAMSYGLPIVSFGVGGIPEQVVHKVNGYISKYKDIQDLTNGIDYYLRMSKKDLEHVGNINIRKVKKYYSNKKMANEYYKLYMKTKNAKTHI